MANMFRLRKEGRRGGETEWVGRGEEELLEAQVFKLHGLEERTEQKFHVGEGGPVDSLHTGMGGDTELSNGNRMFSYRNSRNFWSSLFIYLFVLEIQSMNELESR